MVDVECGHFLGALGFDVLFAGVGFVAAGADYAEGDDENSQG